MESTREGRFDYLLPYIMGFSHEGMSVCGTPQDIQQLYELYKVGARVMEFGSEAEKEWYSQVVLKNHHMLLGFENGDLELECEEVFAYVLYRGNFFWDPPK